MFEGIFHFGKYTYSILCQELDEKVDTLLMLQLAASLALSSADNIPVFELYCVFFFWGTYLPLLSLDQYQNIQCSSIIKF